MSPDFVINPYIQQTSRVPPKMSPAVDLIYNFRSPYRDFSFQNMKNTKVRLQ